jgi:Arc/MetJ-type ribon-helix-helix transcriptional regulator
VKLSVSLPDEDIEFLDTYAREQGATSRSAVIREAVRLLRATGLGADYAADYALAWDEWAEGGDHGAWDSSVADGMSSPP